MSARSCATFADHDHGRDYKAVNRPVHGRARKSAISHWHGESQPSIAPLVRLVYRSTLFVQRLPRTNTYKHNACSIIYYPPKNDAKWNVYNERHSRSTRRIKKPRGQTQVWFVTTRLAKFHHTKQKTPLKTTKTPEKQELESAPSFFMIMIRSTHEIPHPAS